MTVAAVRPARVILACLLTLVSAVVFSCLTLEAQTVELPQAVSRIAGPIDESQRVVLHGNVHPLANPRFDRGEAAESTETGRIFLQLRRSKTQQQALKQYLADAQNPHSSRYHQWLTPA